jgi:uncharacterized RDD family membrane protein YckC
MDSSNDEDHLYSLDHKPFVAIKPSWRKSYYKSNFKKRALATLLDYFTTFMLSTFFLVISFIILGIDLESSEGDYGIYVLQMVFFVLVSTFMEASKRRGTFGKRIMKIQITDDFGKSISLKKALIRNIFKIILGHAFIFIIPLILQIYYYNKNHKLFHDQLTDTLVGERL